MFDNVKLFYDRIFGNRDGKFTVADLPNHAVLIVGLVVDVVMLFAEYRVYQVGYRLTNNHMLAFGFVAVSSVPFLLGQLAFLYNRANTFQQVIAVLMVVMGLFVSAYYGMADYIFQTNTALDLNGTVIPLNANTLYIVAVSCTAALIVGGLLYVLFDSDIANTIKKNRIQAKADIATQELEIKRDLLAKLKEVREREKELQTQYPQDFDRLQDEFSGKKSNPTNGSGKK